MISSGPEWRLDFKRAELTSRKVEDRVEDHGAPEEVGVYLHPRVPRQAGAGGSIYLDIDILF